MAVANAFSPPGLGKKTYDPDQMGWATFTDPEVAQVGLTEDQARERWNRGVEVHSYDVAKTDRALIDGADIGFLKLIAKGGKVVGASMLAQHASDLIHEYAVAVRWGLSVDQLLETVAVYPTYAEATGWISMEPLYESHFSTKGRGRIQKLMKLTGNADVARIND